eukprot:3130177-Pyramimonas_sp.AAC.1
MAVLSFVPPLPVCAVSPRVKGHSGGYLEVVPRVRHWDGRSSLHGRFVSGEPSCEGCGGGQCPSPP